MLHPSVGRPMFTQTPEYRLGIALALGLLVGVERERRKGVGSHRAPAGIRTFAIVTLLGALAAHLSPFVLAIGFVAVVVLAAVAYARDKGADPGATTEVALLVMFLVGALTMTDPMRATIVGITVAVLLAARERLHRFVRDILTEQEVQDGLMLAAAAFIVLPLLPDRYVGPFDAINPRTLWRLVVLVMAIGAAAHALARTIGARAGLPLLGLATGFISGTVAIGAMGSEAKKSEEQRPGAIAGAVLSVASTFVQLGIVSFATSASAGRALLVPVIASVVVALVGALIVSQTERSAPRASRAAPSTAKRKTTDGATGNVGRAFEPKTALGFALMVGVMLFLAAAAREYLGTTGVLVGAAVTGFADAHTSAIAIAGLVASEKLSPNAATIPILIATTTNCISKVIVAHSTGGARFAKVVSVIVASSMAAAWFGLFFALR